MEADDIVKIATAYAAPLFTFLGILAQVYFANKGSKERKEKEQRQNEKLDTSTEAIREQIEENTELARENHKLIEQNTELITQLTKRLTANDITTVAVARQHIRQMYYSLRGDKQISDTDYRAITELYTAYKGVTLPDGTHPNSWCDALYEEMSSWKRVEAYPATLAHLMKSVEEKENK